MARGDAETQLEKDAEELLRILQELRHELQKVLKARRARFIESEVDDDCRGNYIYFLSHHLPGGGNDRVE